MNKYKLFWAFLIFFCSLQILNAQDFESFLNNALQNNPNLKSSEIDVLLAKEKGSILTKFENPIVGFDYANYDIKEKKKIMMDIQLV